jgi:hypothetical protein
MLHLLPRLQVRQWSGDHLGRDYANVEKLSQHIGIIVLVEAVIKAHSILHHSCPLFSLSLQLMRLPRPCPSRAAVVASCLA